MSIISIDPFMIKGKSGNVYQFVTYPLDAEFPENSGVYIYAKYHDSDECLLIYFGESNNLKNRINAHRDPEDTINIHHPNYIFIYNTDTEAQALNIEADILTNNNFLENHQLQNNKQE